MENMWIILLGYKKKYMLNIFSVNFELCWGYVFLFIDKIIYMWYIVNYIVEFDCVK